MLLFFPLHPFAGRFLVCSVVLTMATDLMRPGSRGFADTPTVVLGHHYLSRRQLGGCGIRG